MSQFTGIHHEFATRDGVITADFTRFADLWPSFLLTIVLATLALPLSSHAESRMGTAGSNASVDFSIVIPAIIRITPVTQPEHIVIEDRHIAQGYIDFDAGTSVKLTINSRDGYLLDARYGARLLSSIEVRIENQSLTASSGAGSVRVASAFVVDKLVAISYRLYLAPGVQAGNFRWPVTLAFSLASA